jgi:endo-1,4-beta-xylanase
MKKKSIQIIALTILFINWFLCPTILNGQVPNNKGWHSTNFAYRQELNPYTEGVPEEAMQAWTNRMNDFFKLFLKHSDKVSRIMMWGISDGDSWKNDFPVHGRTDYPLLFDRQYNPKPIVGLIIDEVRP